MGGYNDEQGGFVRGILSYTCADQAGWKKAHSGQYLCYSHATTLFLLMTKILCAAGRRVPLGD